MEGVLCGFLVLQKQPFFLACEPNPATRMKNVPTAMKCRRYSEVEAANRTLQMQMHCAADWFKREDTVRHLNASAMAITASLALGSTANLMERGRGVLSAMI